MLFGLALSIGAFSLVSSPPATNSAVLSDLFTFGFSFLILIVIWLQYTRVMSVLPLESSRTIRLNIMLLFAVSIEPFLFNLVNNPPVKAFSYGDFTTTLYALDLASLMGILGFFTLTVADEDRKLVPKDELKRFKRGGLILVGSCGIFLVTALPPLYTTMVDGVRLRLVLWYIPIITAWAARRSSARADRLAQEA